MMQQRSAPGGPGFFTVPAGNSFALRNVRLPAALVDGAALPDARDGMVGADILITAGRIAGIAPAGHVDAGLGPDLDHSVVLPGLVDCHTHLDKGHIWPRAPNPTGDVPGAAATTKADRIAHWNAEDVERRMEFGLATAFAKGVVAIRTHLDSLAPQAGISFPIFRMMRERWSGRIDLQVSSLGPLDMFLGDEGRDLADHVADSNGNLGCATRFAGLPNDPIPEAFDIALGRLFDLATERGIDIDLHVDESGDPAAQTLIRVARMAVTKRFKGRILCGHCSSLAVQPDEIIRETIAACVEGGVDIVTLPVVNMYLQGRGPGVTPRWRGVTVVHEMKAAGLRVAVAGDNVRDPFYAYGDHDMLETFTQGVKILHLDHPIDDWIRAASAIPAAIMGLDGTGALAEGRPADLIVLKARSYSEMLSRHQFDRVVIRNGRQIDTTLPDYRDLDAATGW